MREAKIISGNPTKKPIPPPVVAAAPASLRPPARLSAEAKRVWLELAPELEAGGLLTSRDMGAFEEYCAAISDLRAARRAIGKSLARAENKHQQVSPYWTILERSRKAVLDLGARFGLTPLDRARPGIGISSAGSTDTGGIKSFLDRGRGA